MAILINPLGKLRGKCGEFIFKQVNGRTIIARRPLKYATSQSPKAVGTRDCFGSTVRFSKFINSVDILKKLWAAACSPDFGFNTIVKLNYPFMKGPLVTSRNIIVPDTSKPSPVEDVNFEQEVLQVRLYKDYTFAPVGTLIVITALIKKELEWRPPFEMCALYHGKVQPGDTVLIPLPDYKKWKCEFDRCIVYSAVLVEVRKKQFDWMRTSAKELRIE